MTKYALLLCFPVLVTAADSLPPPGVLLEYEIRPYARSTPGSGPPGLSDPWDGVYSNELLYGTTYEPPKAPPLVSKPPHRQRPQTRLEKKYFKELDQAQPGRWYHYSRTDLAAIIEMAFGLDRGRIQYPRKLGKKKYEIYLEATDAARDRRAILRALLVKHFGLSYRRETRPLEILVMKTPASEPALPPSTRTSFQQRIALPKPFMRFRGCRLADAARYLGSVLRTKIVDESNSTLRYDFDLRIDPPDLDSWRQMVKDVLGADLVKGVRPTKMVIVEEARRLKKPVRRRSEI